MVAYWFQVALLVGMVVLGGILCIVGDAQMRQQARYHKELMATLDAFATMVGDLLEKRSEKR